MSAGSADWEGVPGSVRMVGPDGVERLYVPVPEGECEQTFRQEYVIRVLKARRASIAPAQLARLMGVDRSTIYREIHAGRLRVIRLPGGTKREMRISSEEALAYYESLMFDPLE